MLSPGARLLAVQRDDGVALLDTVSGLELALLPGPIPVAFLPGNELRTGGPAGLQEYPLDWNEQDGVLRVRPARTLVSTPTGDPWGQSRDGSVVAIPEHGRGFSILRLGAALRPIQPPRFRHDVRSCAVSPDGHWVATGSHNPNPEQQTNARVWDSSTGRLVRTFPVGEFCVVQFSPAGTWLATASRAVDECRLWRVGTWEPGPRFARTVPIAFSRDDRLLAGGGPHGVVVLYEAATSRKITRLTSREMTTLLPQCFAPDRSRLYAIGVDNGLLHVWDLRQIRDGLDALGLAQGWPEFPPIPPEADSPAPLTVEDVRAHQDAPP